MRSHKPLHDLVQSMTQSAPQARPGLLEDVVPTLQGLGSSMPEAVRITTGPAARTPQVDLHDSDLRVPATPGLRATAAPAATETRAPVSRGAAASAPRTFARGGAE